MAAWRSTGSTFLPSWLSYFAGAHAELGHHDQAWRSVGEALSTIETTKEKWCAAEFNRTAGQIALLSANSDAAKAEAYFERALSVARREQAKSWELPELVYEALRKIISIKSISRLTCAVC
jgi:predicted ATPase